MRIAEFLILREISVFFLSLALESAGHRLSQN